MTGRRFSNVKPYRLFRGLAWIALAWEAFWPRFWPAVSIALLFVGVALSDMLPLLGAGGHTFALAGFVGAFLIALAKANGNTTFPWPSPDQVRRRLERGGQLSHRPLGALEDNLALGSGDSLAEALWLAHRKRAQMSSKHIRPSMPDARMAHHDPLGLRVVPVLVLTIGVAMGFGDSGQRLQRAVLPMGATALASVKVDVWVTPPAYTGMSPVVFDGANGAGDGLAVVEGSTVLIHVGGGGKSPRLRYGGTHTPFVPLSGTGKTVTAAYRSEVPLTEDGRLIVEGGRGRTLLNWPVEIIADRPPEVDFLEAPTPASGARLKLTYGVDDDFGARTVNVVFSRPNEASFQRALPMPRSRSDKSGSTSIAQASHVLDLAAHRWAGTTVQVHLEANDAIGQTGRSQPLAVVLPQRVFTHPVARDLAAVRKMLNDPSRASLERAQAQLFVIAALPDRFANSIGAFLTMSAVRARLAYDQTEQGRLSAQDVLWDLALALEDGGLSLASRALEKLRSDVLDALNSGRSDGETERLLDALKAGLSQYMQALAQQLRKQGTLDVLPTLDADSLGADDFADMIERARDLMRGGATDAAQNMIAEMGRMLEDLRRGMENLASNDALKKAGEIIEGVSALTQDQSMLADKTFGRVRAQQAERLKRTGSSLPALTPMPEIAAEQAGLANRLRSLSAEMKALSGDLPDDLVQAEKAMDDATGASAAGLGGAALDAQRAALESLRRATKSISQSLVRATGGLSGTALGRGMSQRRGHDPFGRGIGGNFSDGPDGIPTQVQRRRVRDILLELRRRAGEQDRSPLERNYIERLLDRY